MSKCLRCGAGPEWLQGKIPDEQPITAALAAEREKREAWETAYKQAFDVGQQLREQLAADTSDQMKAQLAIEIGLIRSVLSTLIQWLAQSATGVISISDAKSLLEKLDSINK